MQNILTAVCSRRQAQARKRERKQLILRKKSVHFLVVRLMDRPLDLMYDLFTNIRINKIESSSEEKIATYDDFDAYCYIQLQFSEYLFVEMA